MSARSRAPGVAAPAIKPVARPSDHAAQLEADIRRAERARQLMLVADTCLRTGADHLLLQLGFSVQHVAELRRQAGPHGGYPRAAIRNIDRTLRLLRRSGERQAEVVQSDFQASEGNPGAGPMRRQTR